METLFHLSTSKYSGNAQNNHYPHRKKITNVDQLVSATAKDHCVGVFEDDKRSKDNFIKADCIFMDVDNFYNIDEEKMCVFADF